MTVSSPCISDCRIDDSSGLCLGCARTRTEIAVWRDARDEDRNRILSELPGRRERLGIRIQKLGWAIEDIRAFILSTLKPGGGTWVSGLFGAVAEFCVGDEDGIAVDICAQSVIAQTAQGAISFNRLEQVSVFSIGVSQATEVIVFAFPREDTALTAAPGLTRMGLDEEAIRPENRHETLYDFGLASVVAGFCVRTDDPGLMARLDGWLDETYRHFLPALGKEFIQVSPVRVVRNAIGRIEVFTPIPAPGEQSPSGPHTHFLPEYLAQGHDLPPNLQIPDAYVPCFIHYPALSSH